MTPTFEQAIDVVSRLTLPEREKVREWIDENRKADDANEPGDENFRRSMQWIDENTEKFDGQWVALDGGGELLAHGTDGRTVHAEAQARGVKTPLMHRVSRKEKLPFGGW